MRSAAALDSKGQWREGGRECTFFMFEGGPWGGTSGAEEEELVLERGLWI